MSDGASSTTTYFPSDINTRLECGGGFEPHGTSLSYAIEEIDHLYVAPDGRIAEHFHRMLQLVADQLYEPASCRTAPIDTNVEDTMWAGNRDRHHQTRPGTVSAYAFLDVHEPIGPIDRLDEATERRRSLDALGDCVGDSRARGTDTRKILWFGLGRCDR